MYKQPITLISKETGEKYYFESVFLATCFLNRGSCYINNTIKWGCAVTHGDTGEEFEVIREKIVTKESLKPVDAIAKNANHQQMLNKSICNGCARAVCFCSWFREHKPVEGWTAEETFFEGEFYSYKVTDCPLFEEDAPTVKERRAQRKRLMLELMDE